MDSLFIPLRSNAAWFTSEEDEATLESRLKAASVIQDSLTFQDGRYSLVVFENGSFDWDIPPEFVPGDRATVRRYTPGRNAQFAIRDPSTGKAHPLLAGPAVSGYEADFFGLLQRSGLHSRDYCELRAISLTEEGKNQVKAEARPYANNAELVSQLDVPTWERNQVVCAAYIDSSIAVYLRQPYLADPRVASFVTAKSGQISHRNWGLDLRPFVLETLARLTLPDFGELTWDEVHEVRQSPAGRDFRRYIYELAQDVTRSAADLEDPQDVTRLIEQRHIIDLAEEIASTRLTTSGLAMSLSLNLLPFGGLVGGSAELMKLVEQSKSWMSFISPRQS